MRKVISVIVLLMVGLINLTPAFANDHVKNIVGNWTYSASDAPMGYQNGKIVFSMKQDKLEAKIFRSDGFEIEAKNVKVVKDKVSFEATVENEYITVNLVLKSNKLEGDVSTYDTNLSIVLTKEN